jgi:hypothetical protein
MSIRAFGTITITSLLILTLVSSACRSREETERPGAVSGTNSAGATGRGRSTGRNAPSTVAANSGSVTSTSSAATAVTANASGPDYKIDAMVDWYRFESLKCGNAAGVWDLRVSGVRPLAAGATLALTGKGRVSLDSTLNGPWSAQYTIRANGVPDLIGGQDGTVTGRATLAGDVLQIRSQVGQGTFFSQTPAVALGGAAENPAKDFDLPVISGHFC